MSPCRYFLRHSSRTAFLFLAPRLVSCFEFLWFGWSLSCSASTVSYGLSEVLQLNPIKYQYKKELVDRIGFSAQQVEPIIPESVYDTKQDQDNEGNTVSGDTIKAMYYVDLIPVLVNAIKELKAENDALKARVITLEGS